MLAIRLPCKAALVLWIAIAGFCACPALGATYYVDAIGGSDTAAGTSPSTAWRTISKVNRVNLQPGDSILFKRDCQFRGMLIPNGSGAEGRQIMLDAYGSGNKPVILRDTQEKEAGAIRLVDKSHYLIQNLEIQSPCSHALVLRGCHHVTVRRCDFTNIAYLPPGEMQGKHEAWSVVVEAGSTDGSYNTIDHCTFRKCSMGMIVFAGDHISCLNSYFYLINGLSSIFAGHCVGKTVTNSRISGCVFDYTDVTREGWNPVMFGGAENCYQEYCETKNTPGGQVDHQVYDFDTECRNCYIQYNYSHDNYGGLLHSYWCGPPTKNSPCFFRYNISVNDHLIVNHVGLCQNGPPTTYGFQMYNNLFYNLGPNWGRGIAKDQLSDAIIRNNIFHMRPGVEVVSLPPGASNNCYVNCHVPEGEPGSTEADPQYIDPRHLPNGLRISEKSPCRAAGAKIDNNGGKDFFGDPLPDGAPSIGPTEWVGPPPPASPNLALHCPVTCSSSYSAPKSGWSESALVDGSLNTVPNTRGWLSAGDGTRDHTEWVTIDLKSEQAINRVVLYPRNDCGYIGVGFPRSFQIRTSPDGKTWTVAHSAKDYPLPGDSPQYFSFSSRKARFVNINMTGLRRDLDGKYTAAITEIEVLNDSSPIPPPYKPSGNFALNKDVTASSSIESMASNMHWYKVKLVDGVRTSIPASMGWSSVPTTAVTRAEWVRVDLGAPCYVSRVDLYPAKDGAGFPIDFRIQASDDNLTWSTVAEKRGYEQPADGLVRGFTFPETRARYVRLVATRLRPGVDGKRMMALAELEVY